MNLMNVNKNYVDNLGAKFKLLVSVAMLGLTVLTTGCESLESKVFSSQAPTMVKITAVGYGAASVNDGYTSGQKKLMAMRTSKLDAYRALAEQIQGVKVNGNSTVASMMAQNDSFRVYVDAFLRGAQLITVTPMADGNYETTMEISLDERFFDKFARKSGSETSGVMRGAIATGVGL